MGKNALRAEGERHYVSPTSCVICIFGVIFYISRSFGSWRSSVTVVTRQPENVFMISGWDGDLCIFHLVQPFSVVHPSSYGTDSGSSFFGVLPPSFGKGTGSSLSGVYPPFFALEAVWGPSTLLWNWHCKLLGVHPPSFGMGTGSSLSGVHPPSFGWALEALCL
jgi:hypothetical protein